VPSIVMSMADSMPSSDSSTLAELREALLRGRPPRLEPGEGNEAFQQHKLLASAVHRAARLDQRASESETDAWVRYVAEQFPPGRNDAADAKRLFAHWRTPLLKDDTPGAGLVITHGQPALHWQRDGDGRLCIDLESMWADFESSVDHLIEYLRTTPDRRIVALKRWRESAWSVQAFQFASVSNATMPVSGASAMGSATVGPGPHR
jgi:hypothetical protein